MAETYLPTPITRIEKYLDYIAKNGGGGGGGTTDYADLTNKPSINGIELVGNKTSMQLDIHDIHNIVISQDMTMNEFTEYLSTYLSGISDFTTLFQINFYGDIDENIEINDVIRGSFSYDTDVFYFKGYLQRADQKTASVSFEFSNEEISNFVIGGDYADEGEVASIEALLMDNAPKNLFEVTEKNDTTRFGVTFTVNKDIDGLISSIVFNGTGTENNLFWLGAVYLTPGSYVLTGESQTLNVRLGLSDGSYRATGTYVTDTISNRKFTVVNANWYALSVAINSGVSYSDDTLYPMIRRAEITDDTFEPYYRTQKQLDTDLSTVETEQETQNQKISEIEAYIGYRDTDIYGLEADFENSIFTRLAGAVGKSAGSDFNSVNAFGGRRRCNLTDDGVVTAYYGDTAYTETGALTQAVTINGTTYAVGTAVQVMVEQPKFYYKMTPLKLDKQTGNGKGYHIRKARYYISDTPKTGFKVHPALVNAGGNVVDYVYLSAYEGSLYDVSESAYITDDAQVADFENDKLSSIANVKPISGLTQNLTRVNAESLSANRGDGWHIENAQLVSMTQLLMLIEYGQFDFQRALGQGVVNIPDNSSYNCSATTGSTSTFGNLSGVATSTSVTIGGTTSTYTADGQTSISYRGQENLYGNIWKFINGINIYGNGSMNGGEAYICLDYNYAESKNTDNYKSVGFTLPNVSNWISAFGYGSESFDWLFMPSEATGGTNALPVGDYEYITANLNGFRLALLGGHWFLGWNAGGFNWHCKDDVGKRDWSIVGRFAFIPL